MAYTTIDDPTEYFETTLFTGNGSTQNITGLNFQPDWIWYKRRNSTNHHRLIDSVRGSNKNLAADLTNAENTESTYVTSFNSDGWSIGSNTDINASNDTIVAWAWKAGGSASSNSDGSITSSVSASTDAGFSIVSYTGTGSNATVGHGLGVAPKWIIAKSRDASENWVVFHKSLNSSGAGTYIYLNTTAAAGGGGSNTSIFNNTAPTSSVFSIGTDGNINNSSDDYIAYCFAEKKGYSKFGSYTGNGHASDGPYIYLGFRPAIVITKKTDGADDWRIFDNKRSSSGFNPVDKHIYPYSSGAEASSSTNSVPDGFDFLSNGFKIRQASAGINASGGAYIYMAFAENPFVNSNGVPTNAR